MASEWRDVRCESVSVESRVVEHELGFRKLDCCRDALHRHLVETAWTPSIGWPDSNEAKWNLAHYVATANICELDIR